MYTHTHTCTLPGRRHLWHWAGSGGALGRRWSRVAPRHFAWQAWHFWAGSGGALGRHWSPVAPRHFAWQAWHLATSTYTLRGRRGRLDVAFAWQTRLLWHWAGSGDRRDWSLLVALACKAGAALGDLGDIYRHFRRICVAGVALITLGWLRWRASSPLVARGAAALCVAGATLGRSICVAGATLMTLGWLWWGAWSPLVARGAAALCVAGVALGDIYRHFAWQVWHLATWTSHLHGRRGTYDTNGSSGTLGRRCGERLQARLRDGFGRRRFAVESVWGFQVTFSLLRWRCAMVLCTCCDTLFIGTECIKAMCSTVVCCNSQVLCKSRCADLSGMAAPRLLEWYLFFSRVLRFWLCFASPCRKSVVVVAWKLRMVLWQQFFHFGADDFPFTIPFKKCVKIVVFPLWRRDSV